MNLAVRPVPIAQIGSYAITIALISSFGIPTRPLHSCIVQISMFRPKSKSSLVSPKYCDAYKLKIQIIFFSELTINYQCIE